MKKLKVVYYADVLCGWCYGFSPVISKIYQEYSDQIDFDVVSGGLFLGNRAGLINEVAPHIKAGAYKKVEALTGVKFGDTFLNEALEKGTMILNSLPHAIAICIIKERFPEKAIEFTSLLHKAVYYNGMDSENLPAYEKYAAQIGFDSDEFSSKMLDPVYTDKALKGFERFGQQEVNVFPSLMLETGDENILLSSGSISYEDLKDLLDKHLN